MEVEKTSIGTSNPSYIRREEVGERRREEGKEEKKGEMEEGKEGGTKKGRGKCLHIN